MCYATRKSGRAFDVRRCGGTLLEVLISLVILAMALRLVVQSAAGARSASRLSRDAQVGSEAAMRWRAARLGLESWSEGEQGRFPAGTLSWRLVAPPGRMDAGAAWVDRWRVLELQREEDERPFWTIVIRLDEEASGTDSQ